MGAAALSPCLQGRQSDACACMRVSDSAQADCDSAAHRQTADMSGKSSLQLDQMVCACTVHDAESVHRQDVKSSECGTDMPLISSL